MMKKFMFLTCCLMANYLAAYENELADKMPQNMDRYQMKVVATDVNHTTQVYILDKEKGIIWMTQISADGYANHKTRCDPWIQLPPLPMQ